jgi:hypothetical protein
MNSVVGAGRSVQAASRPLPDIAARVDSYFVPVRLPATVLAPIMLMPCMTEPTAAQIIVQQRCHARCRNTPGAGGETAFPCAQALEQRLRRSQRTGLVVTPRAGTMLFFRNTLPDGSLDPESLHESRRVITVRASGSFCAIGILQSIACRCAVWCLRGCSGSASSLSVSFILLLVQGEKWAATMWIQTTAQAEPS